MTPVPPAGPHRTDTETSMRLRYLLLALLVGLGAGWVLAPRGTGVWNLFWGRGETRIEEAAILEQLRSVASLVTTEVALRDVITFEHTRLGSTKRSLVVASGTAMVGFDLANHARARIDAAARKIHLTLPRATLLGIDITQLKTYDESRGLWNPFHPEDRDAIYQLARSRLTSAANELGVQEHAQAGARNVLSALFASTGYEVDITFTAPGRIQDTAP